MRTASVTGVVVLHFDFLYLDTESCERCMGTEAALETALKLVAPALDGLDVSIIVRESTSRRLRPLNRHNWLSPRRSVSTVGISSPTTSKTPVNRVVTYALVTET
ncbi:DUF2703 domain-containing protein [Haloarcula marismortui]|uniref:DUF2703 domain-containing protein n=1 Tax=Haloarcula marismortui TaxID=2238 RepID=UPI00373AEC43